MREVVIVEACRTAIGKFGGSLSPLSDIDFGPIAIKEVMKRANLAPDQVDEVIYAYKGQFVNIDGEQIHARILTLSQLSF